MVLAKMKERVFCLFSGIREEKRGGSRRNRKITQGTIVKKNGQKNFSINGKSEERAQLEKPEGDDKKKSALQESYLDVSKAGQESRG